MFSFTPPADPANISNSDHVVYFLDDDPRICRRMTRLLATIGFPAQGFSNLTEFELALARKVPQTVILDLTLGNSGAVETIRSLSAKQIGAAILLLSDNATTEAIDHVRKKWVNTRASSCCRIWKSRFPWTSSNHVSPRPYQCVRTSPTASLSHPDCARIYLNYGTSRRSI